MTSALRPDRRLAPRPLPAHLTSAAGLWLSSRIVLPFLSSAWLHSNKASDRLRALAAEIDAYGSGRVAEALDAEIVQRTEAYLNGLEAYRRHPYRRSAPDRPILWQDGATRLLDYGRCVSHPTVVVVPSLINRYYILDLLPERSFLLRLTSHDLRPLVVDWGEPHDAEVGLGLTGYVDRLDRAFAAAVKSSVPPVALLGYCMGGLLALAVALRRQPRLACLVLLATPWDFHAERAAQVRLLKIFGDSLPAVGKAPTVPVEIVQSLFFLLDPFLAERKFVHFAGLDPTSGAARDFVALEDWINDGVPLSTALTRDCLRCWYGDNAPGLGLWHVAGLPVQPQILSRPTLVVIPRRDRIVPPPSAQALATAIDGAKVMRPPFGHVGMMSAARAPDELWGPIACWLQAQLSPR
jgi:polyhydroxyalkanoate synthase subunit PhaC